MTTANKTAQGVQGAPSRGGIDIVRILLEGRAFFALIVIIVVFPCCRRSIFRPPISWSWHRTWRFTASGDRMLVVILTGGIDLSVGSTLGLCGVVAGALMQGVEIEVLGSIFYPSVWVVVVLTCALGGFIGAVNGVLIAYLKVPAFVATLGVLYCARGVALLLTNG
jgi:erythritol transport system permease protein